ncbi:MAG: hydantoinase B/oxoprolinase family protein [Hyphomicrobiales bacterium]|nr:hydantoinase B/oxoprolinase family protein [Hyphomicrobiales bacterium]
MRRSSDDILLEILIQRFRSIAEEMGYALQRTGYTVFVNETADLGVALVTPGGEIFGYPDSIGIATFANLDCSEALSTFAHYDAGDIVITNDAYTSGSMASHLPDINVFKPVFHAGKLVCFVFAYVHSTDVGGKMPGSISPTSHEVFQEGIRIPPVKLYKAGELNRDVLDLVLANCRAPDDNRGDLRAMVTALDVGERRIAEVIARYGVERFSRAMDEVLDYSESRARRLIAGIPDGTYRFSDYLDDDVASPVPIKICAAVTIRGSDMHIDFSGTDPQLRSAFNIYTKGKPHPWLVFKIMFLLLTIERDIPVNAGILRPVSVHAPEGSVVNCRFPAAIGMRTTTGLRVQDAVFGALAQAMPDLMPAAGAGAISPMVFAEPNQLEGGLKVTVLEPLVGGTGAHAGGDGVHSRDVVDLANMRNNPIEIVEASAAVRILRYGLVPDSGGPGRFRGGCGSMLEFEVLSPDCSLTPRGLERHRFRPWGLRGGGAGANGCCWLQRNGADALAPVEEKIDTVHLGIGDTIRIVFPGGGGWGEPLAREPERVLQDVLDGVVSEEAAARDYGVVIRDRVCDQAATAALRAGRRRPDEPPLVTFGAEREAYERIWTEDVWKQFMDIVYGLPPAFRSQVRLQLWRAIEARAASGRPVGVDGLRTEWEALRPLLLRGGAPRAAVGGHRAHASYAAAKG